MIRPARLLEDPRRGAALLVVLLAMTLLFSLGVPFLFTGQMRSEAARETFDRSRARVAVASASQYAGWAVAETHPALDPTPWWDAVGEWRNMGGVAPMPQALGGAWEELDESWGIEAESMQSLVSLATASPQLLQNLLHPCFLAEDATFGDSTLAVTSTDQKNAALCAAADRILVDAAGELATLIGTTATLVGFTAAETVPVSYSGGMFSDPVFLQRFRVALDALPAAFDLRPPLLDPAVGAALYAAKQSGHPLSADAVQQLAAAATNSEKVTSP